MHWADSSRGRRNFSVVPWQLEVLWTGEEASSRKRCMEGSGQHGLCTVSLYTLSSLYDLSSWITCLVICKHASWMRCILIFKLPLLHLFPLAVLTFVTSMVNIPFLLNSVIYLQGTMHMGVSGSATTVTNLVGATSGFALIGAFLSDSYITRSRTILLFGPLEFLVILFLVFPTSYSLEKIFCMFCCFY